MDSKRTHLDRIITADTPVLVEIQNPELLAFINSANVPFESTRIEYLNDQLLFFIRREILANSSIDVHYYDQTTKKCATQHIPVTDRLLDYFKIKDNCLVLVDKSSVRICVFSPEQKKFALMKRIDFPETFKAALKSMRDYECDEGISIQMFKDGKHLGILKRNVEFYFVDLEAGTMIQYNFPPESECAGSNGFIPHSDDEIVVSTRQRGESRKWFQIKLNINGTYNIVTEVADYQGPGTKLKYQLFDLKNTRIEASIRPTGFSEFSLFNSSSPYRKIESGYLSGIMAQAFPAHDTFVFRQGGDYTVLTGHENILNIAAIPLDLSGYGSTEIRSGESAVILSDKVKILVLLLSVSTLLDQAMPMQIPLPLIRLITSYLETLPILTDTDTTLVKHTLFSTKPQIPLFELKMEELHSEEDLRQFAEAFDKFIKAKKEIEISSEVAILPQLSAKLKKIFCYGELVQPYYFTNQLKINDDLVNYLQKTTNDRDRFEDPGNFAKDILFFLAYDEKSKSESAEILAVIKKYKIDLIAEKMQEIVLSKLVNAPRAQP